MATPFLLTSATYYGTLAAARSLGRAGIPVVLADGALIAHTRWSRHVTRREPLPTRAGPAALLGRFLEIGRAAPGMVLYPTSDDLAWLFSAHRHQLAEHFRLLSPTLDVVYGFLNKQRLHDLCGEAGLESPITHFPADLAEVERLAHRIEYPVMVKPQTQIFLDTKVKGRRVDRPGELVAAYVDFVRQNRYHPEIVRTDPGVVRPMIQAFHVGAAETIHSVSGFAAPSGEVELRAATKILQWPRKIGTGICFEAEPVAQGLGEKLAALCRRVGYHGAFEVEFIREGDRSLLIDFNPRFYGQMGFEEARGLEISRLVHAAACGDAAEVARLLAASREHPERHATAYCNTNLFELVTRGQRALGVLGREEYRRWRAWARRHRGTCADAVWSSDDRVPGLVDFLQHLAGSARHPRAFLRTLLELGPAHHDPAPSGERGPAAVEPAP
ncbi:MAG: carbamoyl-phosphate synthase [Anaeromyxobacter sp.]